MKIYKRVICADGFTISIQANQGSYCEPRNDVGPYSCVELGFPSMEETVILRFAEEPASPTESVYGYVPVKLVRELLERHGGPIWPIPHERVKFAEE